ncbi:hypothetical protein DPMN_137548 [Dreissena polymorpha]|uniref:Uncharacterized protein n=1 Tax=Dreissena polymorpha TaxID=45954 RepID=A0A9D4G2Y6_DREPO|nr:hypothetical protein DPMN_137548 [Dreissena polymorpha]
MAQAAGSEIKTWLRQLSLKSKPRQLSLKSKHCSDSRVCNQNMVHSCLKSKHGSESRV